MDNRKDSGNQGTTPGQTPTVPTDKGEDSGDRQRSAGQAWQQGQQQQQWDDRQGVPRGTPEQGKQAPDRVGGSGTAEAEPEIDDDDPAQLEGGGKRGDLGSQDDKRQASSEDQDPYRASEGTPSKKI